MPRPTESVTSETGNNCTIKTPKPLTTPGWEGLIPIARRPSSKVETIDDLSALIGPDERVTTGELDGFMRKVTVNEDGRAGWVPMEWVKCGR